MSQDNVTLITEFAALIHGINPTISRIVEEVDTERARDGDTITDVLLAYCDVLGDPEPALHINSAAETFAHYAGGMEDELQQAREKGGNLVVLEGDAGIYRTWLVTDDTAATLKPLTAPH